MGLRMRMHIDVQMQMRLGRTGMLGEGFEYVVGREVRELVGVTILLPGDG